MTFVIGIDGGGTKTQGILCSSQGEALGVCTGGPSNHQYLPKEEVRANICELFLQLMEQAAIQPEDIGYVYLGLAGADSEEERLMLTALLTPVFGKVPYCVENDIWSAAAAVPSVKWGAIAICGTGYNMAFRSREGKKYTLRAMEYEHGNLSATAQLIKDALHYAFCSEEHTGRRTELEKQIPGILGVPAMGGVLSLMREMPQKVYGNGEIAKEIFVLARAGDRVCQDILIRFGNSMGEMLGNFIKNTAVGEECIPVVLSGSLFTKAESRLHIDSMCLTMRREVPDFKIIFNYNIPAAGSCIEAVRALGLAVDTKVLENMGRNFVI